MELKKFPEALADFRHTLELKPDYRYPWNNIAWVDHLQGQHAAALKGYDQTIALFPDYALPYYNKGDLLLELKRYPKAPEALRGALRQSPGYVTAWYNLGLAYDDQGAPGTGQGKISQSAGTRFPLCFSPE